MMTILEDDDGPEAMKTATTDDADADEDSDEEADEDEDDGEESED